MSFLTLRGGGGGGGAMYQAFFLKDTSVNVTQSFVFEMSTEKTYQLLAIARRHLFFNEIIIQRTKFVLAKRIIEFACRGRQENLVELNAFIDIGVN